MAGDPVDLPWPARNELRGAVRRYLRLNAELFDDRGAWLDLLWITRGCLEAWTEEALAEPTRAWVPSWAEAPELPEGGEETVLPVVDWLVARFGVRWTEEEGRRARSPRCLRTSQNDWGLHRELREIFADGIYDRDHVVDNLWHWHLRPPPGDARERARWLVRDIWGAASLTEVVSHEDAALVAPICRILGAGAPGAGGRRLVERAWRWLALFSGEDRVILTTAREPEDPESTGTLMAPGSVSSVEVVMAFAGDRVGLLMHQHWGMAD